MRVQIATALIVVGLGGCYATTGVGVGYVAPAPVYSASVTVDTYQPDLVDVGGGVQVIADYDEPIFYSDSFYWRYYGGTWYRSSVYNGGWVVYHDVPYRVRRIDRPHAYVRYRPAGYTPRHRDHRHQPAVRDHRRSEPYRAPAPTVRDHRDHRRSEPYRAPAPTVRDHRPAPAPTVRDHRPAPAPTVRDHRQERRDDRGDKRKDRRRDRDHRD